MVKLGDVFELQMGKTPSRSNQNYWNDGSNKWVSISDLSVSHKYINKTKESITDLAIKESGIKVVPKDTVIMSFKLSLGKTSITSEDIYTNEAIMAFLDKKIYPIYNDFIYYVLKNKNWMEDINKAVMGATLNKATLTNIKIPLPPLDVQMHIADTLDKTQEIINGYKKLLEELDNLIKATFYDMFGDPTTNEMKWQMSTLSECCNLIKDGPHASPNYVKNGVPFVSVNNIIKGYWDLDNTRYISREDYEIFSKRCKPEFDDVLYTKGGTTGFAKYVDIKFDFMNWVHIAVLKYKKDILNGKFLEQMLNSDYCYTQSQRFTRGIANRDLVLGQMAKIKLFIPPLDLQNKFTQIVTNIEEQKAIVKQSLSQSQNLFNSLMSKYFD